MTDDTESAAARPIERPAHQSRRRAAVRAIDRIGRVEPQSVVTLRNACIITDTEIDAAVDAFFACPRTGSHVLGRTGYTIDLMAAVQAHRPSRAVISDKTLDERRRRMTVRTAILLAPLMVG